MGIIRTTIKGMISVLPVILLTLFPFIQPLPAKESKPSLRKTSACDSFGIQIPQVKKDALPFSLKDLNGKRVSLYDFKGNPLLLMFWGTLCDACKEDMPLLEKLAGKIKGQIEVLTITIDGESERRVKRVVKEHQITLSVLLDNKEKLSRAYGVWMIPTAFLINGEGVIEGIVVGQREWDKPEALSAIKELFDLR